jgi:hypothetical protein
MLAMADQHGRVHASIPGLANRARVPVEDARKAIDTFLSPDRDSRTKDFEGRRVEEIDGGWRLINHEKYRGLRDDENILESKRKYIRERREREKAERLARESGSTCSVVESTVDRGRANAEADTEAEAEKSVNTLKLTLESSPASAGEPATVEVLENPKPKTEAYVPPSCPQTEVLALWAEVMPDMPQHLPNLWKGTRADHLRARWRESAVSYQWRTPADGLKYLRGLFEHCRSSKFLMGKTASRDRRPFELELAWLVNPTNWAKVIEGKFHA